MPPARCSAARGFFQAASMISPLESTRFGLRAGLHVEFELRTAAPQLAAVQVESVGREADDVPVVDVEFRQFDQTVGRNGFVGVALLAIAGQIRVVPGEDHALRTVLDFGILRAEIRAFDFPSNNWKHEGTKLNGTDSVRRPTHLARHGEELL